MSDLRITPAPLEPALDLASTLKVHGVYTLGELAGGEWISAPSMNRTVNGLEESGHLTRSPDPADRRKVSIILSDGPTIVEETARRRDAWLDAEFAALTPSGREALASAAEIMRAVAAR